MYRRKLENEKEGFFWEAGGTMGKILKKNQKLDRFVIIKMDESEEKNIKLVIKL